MSGDRPTWKHGLPYGYLQEKWLTFVGAASLLGLSSLGGYIAVVWFTG